MTLFASLNGLRVTSARVRVPYTGVWYAELDLDDEAALLGPVLVRIGRVELRGTVVPAFSGGFELTSRYFVVGGARGWMKRVDPLHFHNDAKVKRSTVLLAVARAVGEKLEIPPGLDERMEASFVLQAGPASRIVRQVLGSTPWWVGFDGITRIGTRELREITEPYDLLSFDPREKIATLSADDPAAIGVGSVLRARLRTPLVVRELELEVTRGTLRITAWCKEGGDNAPADERTLRTLRALIRESLPEYTFLGRYRVSARPEAWLGPVAPWLRLGEAPPGRPPRVEVWTHGRVAAGRGARCGDGRGERAVGSAGCVVGHGDGWRS